MSHQSSFLLSKLSDAYDKQRLPHALIMTSQSKAAQENLASQLCDYMTNSASTTYRQQQQDGSALFEALDWDEPIDSSLAEGTETTETAGTTDEFNLVKNSAFVRVIAPTSKSRQIAIASIRELEQFFSQKSATHEAKVAIIKDAERMTVGAQNAFLKTLEEPPEGCYLILLSSELHQLLPTTRSRCLILPISDQEQPQIDEWQLELIPALETSLKHNFNDEVQAIIAQRTFQDLLAERKATITKDQQAQFKSDTQDYSDATYKTWIKDEETKLDALIESLYIEERNALVRLCQYWLGELILQHNGQTPSTYQIVSQDSTKLHNTSPLQTHPDYRDDLKDITLESLLARYSDFENLENHLKTNAQETLTLESSFLKALS